jgi:Tfp pilus assembly PilM family ATPase
MTLSSLFATPAPPVAVEIAPRYVSAIAMARHTGTPLVTAHAVEPLPAGTVVPALTSANIHDPALVAEAVRRALGRLGGHPRRVALVVPDSATKVSLVRLEKPPVRADDLEQLIRFHVRKAAPFRIEDAQVAFSPAARLGEGGREYVVAVARRDIVQEYERACEAAGAHPGLVDLATFSLINAVLAAEPEVSGDWLLVHVTPDCGTIVILRGEEVIFYRNRAEGSDESLADMVHQTAMYYEDRLGGSHGFSRVTLAGTGLSEGRGLAAAREEIEGRLGLRTESLSPERLAHFTDRISADAGLVNTIAPLVGILARARAGA